MAACRATGSTTEGITEFVAFAIDHILTVTTAREAARNELAHLGFELTTRGEHPGRGTSNHLMFFGRCYWELLSVDEPGPANSMLLEKGHPLGACALRTTDAVRDAQAATAAGALAGPTESFTRPVRIGGEWHTARFVIAPITPQPPADIHFFFCQHLTPELVWPREPMRHPNGAFRLKALHVVGPADGSAERGVAAILGSGGGFSADSDEPQIEYLSEDAWGRRFDAAPPRPPGGGPRLASLALQVRDLEQCAAYLTAQGVPYRRDCGELQVRRGIIGHPIVFAA
jgi:Glyoxalase-like domain